MFHDLDDPSAPSLRGLALEADPADRAYVLTQLARGVPGLGASDCSADGLDMVRLRGYRLARLQAELLRLEVAGALLADPINIRYASGIRNMQTWSMHATVRYAFVPGAGRVVAFEYGGSEHLAAGLETVAEVRFTSSRFNGVFAGGLRAPAADLQPRLAVWAAEIAELTRAHGGTRLAIDRHIDHFSARALEAAGLTLVPAQSALVAAQAIKSPDEVRCMALSVAATEVGMARMRAALQPGITENELWGVLVGTTIGLGGEYSDTRLLSSGGRTNPWYQEATDRRVRPGELVSFDTDMIGPFGYDADISRSFFCGPGRPSSAQRRIYGLAYEQLLHNLELIRPGAEFREMSEQAYLPPEDVRVQQMSMTWHGVGLCGQWPTIVGRGHYRPESGLDGVLEPGMTLCCESYVGAAGGIEGVKLEQQVLVTETGYELLSMFPFEEALLGREV